MRRSLVIACLLALTALAPAIRAEASSSELLVARRLFADAERLERQGEWKTARQRLLQAVAIKETPGLRFHLGFCAEQLGEPVQALLEYNGALDLITGGMKTPDVERLIKPARARVQAQLGEVTLLLPDGAAGAEARLDGKSIAPAVLGAPVPLDPGSHQFEITTTDGRTVVVEMTLKPGDRRTIPVSLDPARPGAAKAAESPVRRHALAKAAPPHDDQSLLGSREVVLISEGAVTLLGLGMGVGFKIAEHDASDRINGAQRAIDTLSGGDAQACNQPAGDLHNACGELSSAASDHDRAALLSTAGFAVAAAGAAATVATFVLWKPAEEPTIALGVGARPGGASLALRGSF